MVKIFLLILLSVPNILFAQQSKAFKIIGHSTFYNNKHLFIEGGLLFDAYNDFEFVKHKADSSNYKMNAIQVKITNGQFTIAGNLKYPHPFVVIYYDVENNRGTNSYVFFVDEGSVNIEIDDLFKNKNLGYRLNSKSNKEYFYLKKLYSKVVDTISGKIYDMQAKQKILHGYIARHPNSYVALWGMALDYVNVRKDEDRKIILENTSLFSSQIKKTKTYHALVNVINHDLELSDGKQFPNIPLNAKDSVFPILSKNKFTLIDFWFSGCEGCVAQFPSYKKTYAAHKKDHFEIIGISVDIKKEVAHWQNMIRELHLNWLQYLDLNGKETEKLYIRKYPTNFLVDGSGKIIKKDISPTDLEIFLQKNLQ